MKEQKEIHIGSLIKEKMEERGLSVSDFAHALHYERTNIYKIFKRSSIDVDLLLRISEVLAYDFLREVYLADEPRRYSITIEADKEDIVEIRKWLLEKRRKSRPCSSCSVCEYRQEESGHFFLLCTCTIRLFPLYLSINNELLTFLI